MLPATWSRVLLRGEAEDRDVEIVVVLEMRASG